MARLFAGAGVSVFHGASRVWPFLGSDKARLIMFKEV